MSAQIAELGADLQRSSQQIDQFQRENHQLRNQVNCLPSPAVSSYCALVFNHTPPI